MKREFEGESSGNLFLFLIFVFVILIGFLSGWNIYSISIGGIISVIVAKLISIILTAE